MVETPRYVPHRSLPDVAYVPGKTARPAEHAPPQKLDVERWYECDDYLWGFDLLAHGFPWEAHETWEGSWLQLDKSSTGARVLQGLIKFAAAHVKVLQGKPQGVLKHSGAASATFREIATAILPERLVMGVDVAMAARACDVFASAPSAATTFRLTFPER